MIDAKEARKITEYKQSYKYKVDKILDDIEFRAMNGYNSSKVYSIFEITDEVKKSLLELGFELEPYYSERFNFCTGELISYISGYHLSW